LAERNGDLQAMICSLCRVVFRQPLAQPVGFNADDGIGVLIESRPALEDLEAD